MRRFLIMVGPLVLLALAIPQGPQQPRVHKPEGAPVPRPEVEHIQADIAALAAFPTRFAGSQQAPAVRDWLRGAIAARGLVAEEQVFPLSVGGRETEQGNLYAVLPGQQQRQPWLLLVAHHDTVNEGWVGEASSLADPESPAPGADDNASGVALLLECMRVLAADPPGRGVIFLFTAAEELGQVGSRRFCELPIASRRGIGWVLSVDQVGRSRSGPRALQLYSREQGLPFLRHIRAVGLAAAPNVLGWRLHLDDRLAKSDHGPFLERGFAAVSLSEGPGYYAWEAQGAGDRPERLDPLLLASTAELVIAIARDPKLPLPAAR